MTPEQDRRVHDVWLRMEYVAPAAREAAVRAECADDPVVEEEVLRLFRVAPQSSSKADACRDVFGAVRGAAAPVAAPAGRGPGSGDVLLDRYVVRDCLGAGAFGTVHRALDRATRELVAVKCVPLRTKRIRDWFAREAASLRRARVLGVVDLHAAATDGGRGVLVMALVDGKPFPGGGFREGDAAAVLARGAAVLEAVAHLHASGLIHHDLKPSNVLVSDAGHVTLVDLGIAEDESDVASRLASDAIVGTLPYMAPELLRKGRATARSDLFAIGLMLVHAVGCVSYPSGRGSAEADASDREELRRRLEGLVPPRAAELLLSLVAREPEDRPPDAWAAADALRAALGPRHAIELPRLGGEDALAAVVTAARGGRALDVVGPPGSGRTRLLADAEERLRAEGHVVHRVRAAAAGDAPAVPGDASPERLDDDLCGSLRRRVADGLVVLADDFDALDAPTRAFVESLRPLGAVVRVVRATDGDCVRLCALTERDLEALVRGPERLFHVRSVVARALWTRTRGRPREVVHEVRSWCATGMASWDGALDVAPAQADRLRTLNGPAPAAPPLPVLEPATRDVWSALTLIGEPVTLSALADTMERPRRVGASGHAALEAAGLADAPDETGRILLVRASPHLADAPLAERQRWSDRAAEHLPPRSEARFRHLAAAERHEAACRAALDVAASRFDAGDVPAAIAVLDPALTLARRHVHASFDLYADLLAAMADAALARATRGAVDLALYHAGLAPERGGRAAAWTSVLEAAAAALDSDPRRALAVLDAVGDLPTEAHRRAAHVVAAHAGRLTKSPETFRARVGALAAWARRGGGGRDARALLAASTGWLRYEQGRFEAACCLHARAARLTRRVRARTTSLFDAAMAAVEAGKTDSAASLAERAMRTARECGDSVNEARAELLFRQCAYREGRAGDPDEDLVTTAARLDRGALRGTIRLTEAAAAWRARRLLRAGALACEAAEDLASSRIEAAAALAAALAAACGARADLDLLVPLTMRAGEIGPIGLAAQAAALAANARGLPPLPAAIVARARSWAGNAALPDVPREVLSPRETADRLAAVG
jgi:hypothetical protein